MKGTPRSRRDVSGSCPDSIHSSAVPRTTPRNATGAVVGYDGVLFVEGLQEQNRVLVGTGKDACEVRFVYKAVAGELPTIGPLVCQPVQGETK